jgi:hypothetical protein
VHGARSKARDPSLRFGLRHSHLIRSPYLHSLPQSRRKFFVRQPEKVRRLIAAGDVRDHDQFVLKPIRPIDEVVQVQVAKLWIFSRECSVRAKLISVIKTLA